MVCLQEIKAMPEQFDQTLFNEIGYDCYIQATTKIILKRSSFIKNCEMNIFMSLLSYKKQNLNSNKNKKSIKKQSTEYPFINSTCLNSN